MPSISTSAPGGGKKGPATTVSVELSHSQPGGLRKDVIVGGQGQRRGVELPDIHSPAARRSSAADEALSELKKPTKVVGLTRKNLNVAAATHSAIVREAREIAARERELELVRPNRADADPLLMESWLNDALTAKDKDGKTVVDPDQPPLALLQQGSGGLQGLQAYGLTRADLRAKGLSPKAIERVYRSMYVYTVGFHDILKEIFSNCEEKADLVAAVWAGYFSISENTLKATFKSEFLEMLGEQRETGTQLTEARDELVEATRELTRTRDELATKLRDLESTRAERDQLMAKHSVLVSTVKREQASRKHVQQKYFSEVEHRSAMAEEVAESLEIAQRLRVDHDAAKKEAKRSADQAVRSDTARRRAQENMRRYLEELKVVREHDEHLTREVAALQTRLTEATAELEELAGKYKDEARHKIMIQADVAHKREELNKLHAQVRELIDEAVELRETTKDALSVQTSLTNERDTLQTRLTSISEELETTQATLLRERTGYSKMTAEWGQMTERLEDLTIREGAAVKRGLALSSDLEAARAALRAEREANASSSTALASSRAEGRTLGVGLATLMKCLHEERVVRWCLHAKLTHAGDVEAKLAVMHATEEALRKDLAETQSALEAANAAVAAANKTAAETASMLAETNERLRESEAGASEAAERFKEQAKTLAESELALAKALEDIARMQEDARKAADDAALKAEEMKELRREHREASARVEALTAELSDQRLKGDHATGSLEEATKKLAAAQERVQTLETELNEMVTRATNAESELSSTRIDLDSERSQRTCAEEEKAEAMENAAQLGAQLSDASSRIEGLLADLSTARQDIDAGLLREQDLKTQLSSEAEDFERQLMEERDAHAEKTRALEQTEVELAAAQTEITSLTATRDQLTEDSQQMERMLKEAGTVRMFLQGEISAYKTRLEETKAAKAETEVKLDLALKAMERQAAEASVKFDAAHKELSEKVKDLEEQLEMERAARQADVDVARQEGAEQLKEWKDSLMAEIGTLKLELANAEKALATTTGELEKAQEGVSAASVKIVVLEDQLAATKAALASSAMSGDEEKQHKQTLAMEMERMKGEAADAANKITVLEEHNRVLAEEVADRDKQLDAAYASVATLEMQLAALKMAKDEDAASAAANAASAAADAATAASRHAEESTKLAAALKWTRGLKQQTEDLVVIRSREVFERDDDKTPLMTFTPQALRAVILQLFCEKIMSDAEDPLDLQTFEEFTYEFFLHRFGLRAVAAHHLRSLVAATEKSFDADPRVRVFGRMVGVAMPVPADACAVILRFLSQLILATGGLKESDFNGGATSIAVSDIAIAAKAVFPKDHEALMTEVTSAALKASKGQGPGDDLDVDVVLNLALTQWEKTSEALTSDLMAKFASADINGDGMLTYDEFSALVASAFALRTEASPSARAVKGMFREALAKSSPHGSSITPEAFVTTVRDSDIFSGGSSSVITTAGGENSAAHLTNGAPIAFDEWGILVGSWETMRDVAARLSKMMEGIPSMKGELQNLEAMTEDFEAMLRDRSAATPAVWTLFRRILVVHATHKQRLEITEMEKAD